MRAAESLASAPVAVTTSSRGAGGEEEEGGEGRESRAVRRMGEREGEEYSDLLTDGSWSHRRREPSMRRCRAPRGRRMRALRRARPRPTRKSGRSGRKERTRRGGAGGSGQRERGGPKAGVGDVPTRSSRPVQLQARARD